MVATTLNPSDKSANLTLSNGNLTAKNQLGSPNTATVRATTSKSSGKVCFEASIDSSIAYLIAIALTEATSNLDLGAPGVNTEGFSYYMSTVASAFELGKNSSAGVGTVSASSTTHNDIIMVAFDFDTDAGSDLIRCYAAKNGTWQNSADPASGTGYLAIQASDGPLWFPAVTVTDSGGAPQDQVTVNFGATAFVTTLPTGYSAWDTGSGSTFVPRVMSY